MKIKLVVHVNVNMCAHTSMRMCMFDWLYSIYSSVRFTNVFLCMCVCVCDETVIQYNWFVIIHSFSAFDSSYSTKWDIQLTELLWIFNKISSSLCSWIRIFLIIFLFFFPFPPTPSSKFAVNRNEQLFLVYQPQENYQMKDKSLRNEEEKTKQNLIEFNVKCSNWNKLTG